MKMDHFSDKLGLVLKTLVLSRTGLASALNVDKSLVGRWAAGTVTPSEHNLAKLTRYIASRVDGFTMLDWEKDLTGFARGLGVEVETSASDAGTQTDLFPAAIYKEGLRGAEMRAEAYEGFWRTTRPSSDVPGCYLRDITMVRRREDGLMGWYTGVEGERFEGWSLLLGHQFFSIGWDPSHGTLMFAIFNGVARQKAEVVEGLSLANLRDAGSSPVCSACVMERIGELSGDSARDDAHFDAQVRGLDPLVPASEVPEEIRAHLAQTISDEVPGMMRMLFTTSMARGPVLDPLGAK